MPVLTPTDITWATFGTSVSPAGVAGGVPLDDELRQMLAKKWNAAHPQPKGPTDGVLVPPGGDVTAALRNAAPGSKVYLQRGGRYAAVTDTTIHPHNVTLTSWGNANQPKPIIESHGTSGIRLWAVDGFTVTGISFVGSNPSDDSAGIDLWGVRNFKASNCEVTGNRMGVTVQPAGTRRPQNVTFDGNYIHDNGPSRDGVDGSGLFAGATDNLVVTNNVFDRNGWSDGYPGSFRNHNLYCRGDCEPATFIGNIFSRASSHGLQARAGGVVRDNWFIDNPIHMSFGLVNGGGPIHLGGVAGRIVGNHYIGTRPLANSPRGWALEISNATNVEVSGNTFAGDHTYDPHSGTMAAAIKLDKCNLDQNYPDRDRALGIQHIVIDGNAILWPFQRIWVNPALGLPAVNETHPSQSNMNTERSTSSSKMTTMRNQIMETGMVVWNP